MQGKGSVGGNGAAAKDRLALLELILDNIYNGVIVTDADGYVIFFNKPYGMFLGIDPAEQIGKHATKVVENTRMHIVAKTGEAEINKAHKIRGQNMVVQRIPIKRDGKVVAVFGQVMFKHVSDVGKLAKELAFLQSKLKMVEEELLTLRAERYTFDSILGTNPLILNLKKEAQRAAATNFPVLITGESGTGKEMFAQAIHNGSHRRLHPFVRLNCASIPRDLLESELFGYEKGAFTGAGSSGKYGKLELADKGTVFLDEIGDMPYEMQPKILRVLEEKELERIGGVAPVKSDFRLIAASNQPIEEMVSDGRFRKDLFYRLDVIRFHIPPLRERRDDIAIIAKALLAGIAKNTSFPEIKIHPAAEAILLNYDWPGNIRELVNVLSRVTCLLERDTIQPYDIPFFLRSGKEAAGGAVRTSLVGVMDAAEKDAIISALASAGNNKTAAAALLGIHRTHLYKKIKKYGL
ncbi:MAG TPA: sigma-54-dependent Fis family transcriptional regulator [Syntrophus sp. (in: bacteria)]|nr:MAG: sigma-54-dependent Fis family transcriptional regulator [Syntrophus sp. GWC2_56_31]HBB17682.1 sigma-54-dependent Fis family transcriptional regulator [Syntrophus sp. (in: bacteria)]